ncbi:papilin-like isoform X2 [Pseudorasbora parva]|uniref:papilin-like isoform X2 n=1 Tax=Pseudorasbora parva TaxID=51549 RepID=UPI00351DFA2C
MMRVVLVFLLSLLGLLHAEPLPDEPVLQTQENFDVKQRVRRNVVTAPPGASLGDDMTMFQGPACKSKPDSGPCFGNFQRFFYNSSVMTCDTFTYGGCKGNQNNFVSEKKCLQSCRTEAACRLPMDAGPCEALKHMWAFDSSAGKCVPFTYGGCKGNGNKFDSQKECEELCGVMLRKACKSKPDSGPCFGNFQRFFYNSSVMTCETFTYGGCKGNQNNFVTEKKCLQSCRTEAACRLPIHVGPCRAHIPMWAFDSSAGKCVPFTYGGCEGNGNKFNSQKECEEQCRVLLRKETCKAKPDSGPCFGRLQRFHYNSSIMTCETFTYGGCMGNQNNFVTEKKCLQSCRTEAACRLPMDAGPCKAFIDMWAFDSSAGKCVPFTYGGCEGNDNKFFSQKECEELCGVMLRNEACKAKPDSGPCFGRLQRFHYNSSVMACETFTYGGCMGNQNNFVTEKKCLQSCRTEAACRLPIDVGPCKAFIDMWAFDSSSGKCVPFTYGGCKGNGNKFYSQKECEELCGVMLRNEACKAKPDSGPCSGRLQRFYYNSSIMTCETFTYGGSMGNQNNFVTEKKCLQSCRTEAACRLPMDVGPCKAFIDMWAFDSSAGKCVPFTYGGCEGNGNKFFSQKECEELCGVMLRKEACKAEPDSGPCFGRLQRFHYNSSIMTCETFTYGGCMGNQNNFVTEKKCLQSCRTEAACRLPMDAGPCRAHIPMWAFDSSAGKCVPFTYGGCEGNGNKFFSQKECEKLC